MHPVRWCRGVGPLQALCERENNHEGQHEGHDAHGYMYYWSEEDYPMPGRPKVDISEGE